MTRGLRLYARFRGRMARAHYWWLILAAILAFCAAGAVDYLLFPAVPAEGLPRRHPVTVFLCVVLVLPVTAAGWRRLHDVNRRGWWLLLPGAALLAFLGLAVLVRQMAAEPKTPPTPPGQPGVAQTDMAPTATVPAAVAETAPAAGWIDALALGLPAIALLFGIGVLLLLARRGDPHANRFGPPPF
ncbi:DUF805 domain-containing protein [Mesobaculum littorinae]|nr:DUF805 domain-containing protein [Mesobaculum littorinae]